MASCCATRRGSGCGGRSAALRGAFLACTFWLVSVYALMGRADAARALFERLLALRNDLGLLAEEYDPSAGRLVGNFPQAFSHLTLITAAAHLAAIPADSHAG